jgi:hypothetical protein
MTFRHEQPGDNGIGESIPIPIPTPTPINLEGLTREMMRKIIVSLLLIVLLPMLLPAQEKAGEGQSPAGPIPSVVRHKLAGLLPNPKEVGTELAGRLRFYSSDLYEYIDGAADGYNSYDFVALIHQEYKSKDAEVTVDIYDMGKPLNAFGIYASERSPDYHFAAIGAEGYIDDSVLNFFQGQFYIKLSAFTEKGTAMPLLEAFAQKVSEKIGAGKSMPEVLTFFPAENLVAHSQKFLNKSPLGHDFLGPAVMASYSFGGKETSLLISKAAGAAAAKQRVDRLREYFGKSGKVAPEPDFSAGSFRGINQYEGEMVFFSSGPYAILCVAPPPQPKPFLDKVLERIAKAGPDLFK